LDFLHVLLISTGRNEVVILRIASQVTDRRNLYSEKNKPLINSDLERRGRRQPWHLSGGTKNNMVFDVDTRSPTKILNIYIYMCVCVCGPG
jgi:hypothetical protein